jgi:hypothetical protein
MAMAAKRHNGLRRKCFMGASVGNNDVMATTQPRGVREEANSDRWRL